MKKERSASSVQVKTISAELPELIKTRQLLLNESGLQIAKPSQIQVNKFLQHLTREKLVVTKITQLSSATKDSSALLEDIHSKNLKNICVFSAVTLLLIFLAIYLSTLGAVTFAIILSLLALFTFFCIWTYGKGLKKEPEKASHEEQKKRSPKQKAPGIVRLGFILTLIALPLSIIFMFGDPFVFTLIAIAGMLMALIGMITMFFKKNKGYGLVLLTFLLGSLSLLALAIADM